MVIEIKANEVCYYQVGTRQRILEQPTKNVIAIKATGRICSYFL